MELKSSKWVESFHCKYKETVSEWFIVIWMMLPLLMGVINYEMLKSFEYDAFVYYDCYKIVVAVVLSVILLWAIVAIALIAAKAGKNNIWNTIVTSEKWLLWWIALPLWSLLSVFFSVSKSEAFWGVEYMAEGYMAHLFGLALMLCASFLRTKVEREKVLTLFCIVTDILTLVMLSFEYGVPFLKDFTADTGVSTFANSNHFGYILAMAIMCMAGMYFMYMQEDSEEDKKKRNQRLYLFLASYVINTYALMINDTLGVFFAVSLGLIALMVFWRIRIGKLSFKHFIPIVVLVVLTAISFTGAIDNILGSSIGKSLVRLWKDLFVIKNKTEGLRQAGTNRMGLWLDAIKAIKKRPILGYGPGIQYDSNWNRFIETAPHNEYLECALYLGIPGLVMYLGGLITLCVDRCKKLKNLDYTDIVAAGALIGYLISSAVGARRFYTSPYMFIFLGMLITWKAKDDIVTKTKEKQVTVKEKKVKKEKNIEKSSGKKENEKEKHSLFIKIENYGISKLCTYILLGWTILPVLVAVGYVPIGIVHGAEEAVVLFYYQIMYNFSLVCLLGLVGFVIFLVVLSGKRDRIQLSTGALMKKLAKTEVWIVLLLALLGWSFISSLLSDDVVTSFIGTALKRDGFIAYCMYASVFGLAYFIEDKNMIKKFMVWYAGIANIMGLVMMAYEWQIPVLVYMSHSNSSATYMNPNHFGYYLCMSIMCLVGLFYTDLFREKSEGEKVLSKQGWFFIISFTWQIYVLMINNTLGAYIAIVFAMIFLLIFCKIRFGKVGLIAWVPFVIVAVITLMSYLGLISSIWGETVGQCIERLILDIFIVANHSEGFEQAGTNRMGLWIEALKLIPQRPIFGFGPESLTGHFKDVNTYDRPHNEYLQMAVFCGVPALLMYLSALITLCVNRCKVLKTISPITIAVAGVVIGYLISAFFGFTIYYTTPYFFMFLGFVAGSAKKQSE